MNWNDPKAKSRQEVRDAKEDRDTEIYLAMCEQVRREIAPAYAPFSPDSTTVHLIAMKRLKDAASE